ncbi:MAG: OmpH family outer membrane protein [Desulfovibrionaceae bacterium]
MKRILPLLLLLPLLALSVPSAHAGGKTGYIDVRRIVDASAIGKLAQKDMDALHAEREKAIARSMEAITAQERKANEDYSLSPEQRRETVDALRKLYQRHERLVAEVQEELKQEEVKLLAFVLKRIRATVERVARREGFGVVIRDPDAVAFVDPASDITDQVIKELNSRQ